MSTSVMTASLIIDGITNIMVIMKGKRDKCRGNNVRSMEGINGLNGLMKDY